MRILLLLFCFFAMTTIEPSLASDGIPISELVSDKVAKRKIGEQVLGIMKKFDIPGGQFCIAKNGNIIYSGAYGFANYELTQPVAHDNLFRVASISKVITSIAIWQLIERGQLSLYDRVFDILSDFKPSTGVGPDPRLAKITISNLLEHTGGFGTSKGDPQFIYQRAAADRLNEPRPASGAAIVRMAIGDPLESEPGAKSVYSNLGFNILGRVIEQVSGQDYASFVKDNILTPSGVTDMQLGKTRPRDQLAKEVFYWQGVDQWNGWSVLEDEPMQVSHPYGADFAIEPFDAHGGWLASARDLVCVASAVEGHPIEADARTILQPRTLHKMLEPSSFAVNKELLRAQGVVVNPAKHSWSHTGGMSGTSAFLNSFRGELVFAATFNRLPTPRPADFYEQFDNLINTLARELR